MKNHLLQNVKILVLGILTLACLIVAVISAIPEKETDLIMQEPFLVSSSQILANSNEYSTQLTGVIKNTTGKPITLQEILVTVSDGKTQSVVSLDGVSLPPRTTWSYLEQWESGANFNRVLSIRAIVDGEEISVPTTLPSMSIDGVTVIFLLLGAILAFFLTHACKIRYYMMQEDQFKASQEQQ
jgi:hypothetical protein